MNIRFFLSSSIALGAFAALRLGVKSLAREQFSRKDANRNDSFSQTKTSYEDVSLALQPDDSNPFGQGRSYI